MADLDDLLGDISNVDDRDGYDIDQEEANEDGILPGLDNVGIRSEVPSALATAAAIRRRRVPFREDDTNDNDDLGGGQSSLGRRGFEDNGEEDNYGDDDDDDDGDGRNYNPDYETLKALWTSELACPELLPHDAETVLQIVDDLSAQEEIINDLLLRSKQPPPLLPQSSTSRGGGGGGGGPTAELASLVAQITKMDSDRTRFMLVDLARTRMAKIENHAFHNRTLVDRMTEEERSYLRQYGELIERHYRRTVLDHLPKDAWKKLDEPEMIDTPDLEQFVFCRVVETVQIDVRGELGVLNEDLVNNDDDDDDDNYGENIQEHAAGSYLIVMYKQIRDLVLDGKVELLI